jgi:alpha-mannosidase
LAQAKTGSPNAIVAKGQKVELPAGNYDRVYVLAASANGDQKVAFEIGGKRQELNIQDWGGFIGQWDDRQWSSSGQNDNYGDMVGLKPGFTKRADLAWYSTHHHDAAGMNIAYSYSYLFGYALDLPAGSKTIKLPNNSNVRILAISVANENPETKPVQPLYDVLPSPKAGAPDFSITAPVALSVSQGMKNTARILLMPRGGFDSKVKLTAAGLPSGITPTFDPNVTANSSMLTISSTKSVSPSNTTITISGQADRITQTASTVLSVLPVLTGTVPVNLTSAYNVRGIYTDGSKFESSESLDAGGYSFSEKTLGSEQVGDDVIFKLGPPNVADVVTSKTIDLPSGKFASLKVLATAVEGNQDNQIFTVNYADGSTSSFTQTFSDWSGGGDVRGESLAVHLPYRVAGDGSTDSNPFNLFAYTFSLDPTKQVRSVTLPENRNVAVFAMTLVPQESE